MSPVNHDPSGGTPERTGRPLTRRELRARERFLETQQQSQVPLPAPVPAASAAAQTEAVGQAEPSVQPAAAVHPEHQQREEARPAAAAIPAAAPHDGLPAHVDEPVQLDAAPHVDEAAEAAPFHEDAVHHDGGHSAYGDHHHGDDADEGHYDEHHGYDEHHEDHDPHPVLAAVDAHPAPSKKVRRRRRGLALFLTFAVFVTAVVLGAQLLKPLLGMDRVKDFPGPGTGSVSVTVMPGAGPKQVADQLQNEGVVADAGSFLAEFSASGGELSPGDFTFRKEMKNSDAVAVLVDNEAGKVIYFALNAGLRIGESLDAISKGSGIPVAQLKALSDSPAQFGVPAKAKNLEGFLAPGEYRFPLGTSAKDILQKLVSGTLAELKAQGITDPAKQYQAIIVASIVQAEGGQADYRNVAGAIYNRLKPGNKETNGLIQSDATVTYGLGTKTFHLTEEQKADKGNPYNTYALVGLPVGPIGSPGKTAIDAAAKPAANNFLYWVTINLDTKETKFSSTLAEHNRYVAQYTAWCEANPGRCV